MIWNIRLTTLTTLLVLLLQSMGKVVSLSVRSVPSHQPLPLSPRNLKECNDNESNLKFLLDYGDETRPGIKYTIYHRNGTALYQVTGTLDTSTSEDNFFEREYCLDSSSCYILFVNEMGTWDFFQNKMLNHFSVEVEWNGTKIMDGKADRQQYIKVGNCSFYSCTQGEAMLNIQMSGYVGDDNPKSSTFDYAIYSSSGAAIDTQNEGYDSDVEGHHYFETSICLNPSDCYTVWISKESDFQVHFNDTLTGSGRSGFQYGVLNVGEGNCPICNSKPLLVDAFTNQTRSRDIMSVITTISGMEAFLDTNSIHYQAACWIIYDDALKVTAADKSLVQRYILALLFFSTNGWDWSKNEVFLNPVTECDWNRYLRSYNGQSWIYKLNGVECNEDGNVVKIDLIHHFLKGNLVSELSKLSSLESLGLSINHLHGTIPNEFGEMKQIKELMLLQNELSGTIPQGILENQNLEQLDLASNILHGTFPSSTVSLPNLEKISVANNVLNGKIPEDLYNATSLRYLGLQANLLSGTIPQTIGKTSLMYLDLFNNYLSGPMPTQLSNLTTIEEILISNNTLSGTIPSQLGYLSSLSILDLSFNSLNGEIPSSFKNLLSLEKLYIYSNEIIGNIPEELCNHFTNLSMKYSFEADCAGQQMEAKVNCSCCTQCFTHFSFLEHFGECSDTELKIEINYDISREKDQSWFIKDNLGQLILNDGPYTTDDPPESIYTACIARTGCYNMHNTGYLEFEVFVNNVSVHYNYWSQEATSVDFGYSSTSKFLQVENCDDVSVYDKNAPQNKTRRNIFDQLVKISGLNLLNTSTDTPQYKSAKWVIDEYDGLEDSTDPSIIQRYILGVFYHSTNGEFWFNKNSWINAIDECSWYGVTCYDDQTISGINLAQNNLTGSLPFEIGELSFLQNLSLPHNSLKDRIPLEIANLYSLQTLDLGNNTLSGTIPSVLRTLKELKLLNLQNNSISEAIPTEIGHLEKLAILDLNNNTITGSLPLEMYKLSMLERLDVSQNYLRGSIDQLKFQSLSGLTYLDLSRNSFTGTILNSISNFTKLQMLNISQNKFKGSIPSGISNLAELQTLLLHNNELTGSVPTQIGNLENIVNISLSYNLLRGTIPKELGKLQNIKHLLLHRNQLVGDANIFQKKKPERFVTDCGSILDSSAAVTCPYCTECCNSEGNCLSISKTWPKLVKAENERMNGRAGLSVIMILLAVFIGFFAMAYIGMKIMKTSGKNLPVLNSHVRDHFASESVYRFFLSSSKIGWFIALLTVTVQAVIFYVFLNASDFSSGSNEWTYSVDCPNDSLDCMDNRTRNNFGWFMVFFVVAAFLLRDLASSTMLMYTSIAESDIQGLFASLTLMFITVLAIITSITINYAIGLTNAQVLMDSAVVLFLSDIDEALYSAIHVISPEWTSSLSNDADNDRVDYDSVMDELRTAKSERDSMKSEIKQLHTQVDDLMKVSVKKEKESQKINNELRIAKNERDSMESEIKQLRTQVDDLMKILVKKEKV